MSFFVAFFETRFLSFVFSKKKKKKKVDERERRFKALVSRIFSEAEELCKLVSPINDKTYDYLFVVAVPTGKVRVC